MDRISELERRIHDAKLLIDQTRVKLRDYLKEIQKVSQNQGDGNNVSLLEIYKLFLQKEKALYTSLNKLKKEDKLFLGFCWIPK